ncbi:phosphatidylinositol glycan, partial [Aphelenchoides avenae]
MFSHDLPHATAETYLAADEDFASNDAAELDRWVFRKVKDVFARATKDPDLHADLQQDRSVFFLHLLGLDTNGHGNKPHSAAYIDNIA